LFGSYFAGSSAEEVGVDGSDFSVEFFVAFAVAADVLVAEVDFEVWEFFAEEVHFFEGGHAADAAAPGALGFVAASDAEDEGDAFGWLFVGGSEDVAFGGSAAADESFEFEGGDDVWLVVVAEFVEGGGVEEVVAGGDDDGADFAFDGFGLLVELYGVLGAGFFAEGFVAAFAAAEVEAFLWVDGVFEGDGLGEGHVGGAAVAHVFVEFTGDAVFEAAGGGAVAAAGAFDGVDVAGFFGDFDGVVADASFDALNVAVGEEFDVFVVGDFCHFWGEDAGGAVEGGEGFVELCHVAADAGVLVDEVDFEAVVCEVEAGLDAGDAGADD
jgi:hypothetical protein